MRKLIVLMLLMVLLLAHPFGCQTRRIARVQRKTVKLDSAIHKKVSSEGVNMRWMDSKAIFEKFSKQEHTKATYRTEKTISREITLDGEYALDTLKPCSGDTLNFVNAQGERAQVVKEKGGNLKIRGVQKGHVVEREVTEVSFEHTEKQDKSSVDTSKKVLSYEQRRADSILNLKFTRHEEGKVKTVDKTITGLPWWVWLLAALIVLLILNFKKFKKWLNL